MLLLLLIAFIKRHSLCALMLHVILKEWLYLFIARIFNIHRSGSTVWLLHGCCHVKLLPSRRKFCVHHSTMHQFTVSFHSKPRRRGEYFLAATCHLHFWRNDQDLLRATAVTRGWNGYRNKSTESWPWRRKFSCRSCGDSNPGPFDQESDALTTELSPLPTLTNKQTH